MTKKHFFNLTLGSYAMAPADTIDVISLTGPFPDNY